MFREILLDMGYVCGDFPVHVALSGISVHAADIGMAPSSMWPDGNGGFSCRELGNPGAGRCDGQMDKCPL